MTTKMQKRSSVGTPSGISKGALDKKGAFQYPLSSRKYWKILEFHRLLGLKGRFVPDSAAKDCVKKTQLSVHGVAQI